MENTLAPVTAAVVISYILSGQLSDIALPFSPERFSASAQAAMLLHMLGTGVRRGFINMTGAEVDALLAAVRNALDS